MQAEVPRGRGVLRSGNGTNANYGVVYSNANNDASNSNAAYGSRLTNKIQKNNRPSAAVSRTRE